MKLIYLIERYANSALPLNSLVVPSSLLQRSPDELLDLLLGTSAAAGTGVLASGMVDVAQVVERPALQDLWPGGRDGIWQGVISHPLCTLPL